MVGPAGTGKTTLVRILCGEFDWLRDSPWRYDEDVALSRHSLRGSTPAEVIVLPGQEHRRQSTWTSIGRDLAAGRYHGVVLVSAYGHHSLSRASYRQHRLYEGSKDQFFDRYLSDRRGEELACLSQLAPLIAACPGKVWMVSAVAKQDLWRPDETAAENWYRDGEYGRAVEALVSKCSPSTFRHELVPLSLLIGNLVTTRGEILRKNAEGYDHRAQVESVRRLIEVLEGLRKWEREK